MDMKNVLFEKKGNIAIITLNRPQVLNVINSNVWRELGNILEKFTNDPELRVAILTGAGDRAFCAGADLKEWADGRNNMPEGGEKWGFAGITKHFINKPIIAAVNGFAFGGGTEIALACDLIVASENANFGLPEVKRGLIAAGGGLLRLPRQIPIKKAMEYILVGDPISADEGERWGLVNYVVPQDQLLSKAMELARKIGKNAPLSISASKEIVYRGLDAPLEFPQEAWEFNDRYLAEVKKSEDVKEGAKAFLEKREPVWKGR